MRPLIFALLRLLLVSGAFGCGLAGASLLLHSRLPFPDVPEVRAKLEHLTERGHEYDTIFIGSSQIRRQISPQVFDRRMRKAGHPTRSFNFGIDAMTFPELPYVLERVLALKLPNLKLVVLDLNPIRRTLGKSNDRETLRAIYWHDLPRTLMVVRAVWHDDQTRAGEKANLIAMHVELMVRNYSKIGEGAALLQRQFMPRRKGKLRRDAVEDGYFPVDGALTGRDAAAFLEKVKEMREVQRPTRSDPIHQSALRELLAKIRAEGATPVLITAPSVGRPHIAVPEPPPITLRFDDPAAYPSLYDPLRRYDVQHLNATGSVEFTRLLADEIAARLSGS